MKLESESNQGVLPLCGSFSPSCLHLPNWVIESIIFSIVCVAFWGSSCFWGCTIKNTRGRRRNFGSRSWEQVSSLEQLLFISVRRPFFTLSLSILGFLESSSSKDTGSAITRHVFRCLLEGDEKNMRCGRAEEKQQGRVQGTGFDWGWTSCLVGVMCGWRGTSWYLSSALLRLKYQKTCYCPSSTPISCKDPKAGSFQNLKVMQPLKISCYFCSLLSSRVPPKFWNSAWFQHRINTFLKCSSSKYFKEMFTSITVLFTTMLGRSQAL